MYKKKAHASYYADKFNGRKTASGEKFSNSKLTAAHRKLPFGTKVKVTNNDNSKSVIVEINDRGPWVPGRDIDLSKKAFMDIAENKNQGSLKVSIEIVK
jgi:rare lipoprotein A